MRLASSFERFSLEQATKAILFVTKEFVDFVPMTDDGNGSGETVVVADRADGGGGVETVLGADVRTATAAM